MIYFLKSETNVNIFFKNLILAYGHFIMTQLKNRNICYMDNNKDCGYVTLLLGNF